MGHSYRDTKDNTMKICHYWILLILMDFCFVFFSFVFPTDVSEPLLLQ